MCCAYIASIEKLRIGLFSAPIRAFTQAATSATLVIMPRAPRDPDSLFQPKATKEIPFDFVLDLLEPLDPWTRPMFGCTSVYVGERIVFILRDKGDVDSGVWVATDPEQLASLKKELPSLKPIEIFGEGQTKWQVIHQTSRSFETHVRKACALVLAEDARIGRIPKAKKPSAKTKKR